MEATLRRLFPAEVAIATMDPAEADPAALLPEEAAAVARAVDKRRREYAAGRLLARALLRGFDREGPIPRGDRGAPEWPAGIVGSISHTRGVAAVAVARADEVAAIGLDLEQATPLRDGLWRMVCTEHELRFIATLDDDIAGVHAKAVFSAKEAVYKAQYPSTGVALAFDAVDIDLDLAGERFTATFRVSAGSFAAGTVVHGRVALAEGLVATAIALPLAK